MDYMLMPLRRYAEFGGRSRRMEFWMWQLAQLLLWIAVAIVGGIFGLSMFSLASNPGAGAMAAVGVGIIFYGVLLLVGLALFIPNLAVAIRRLHDTDRAGWWVLSPLAGYLVTIVGAVAHSQALVLIGSGITVLLALMLVVFYFLDGTPGPNRFGADPKLRGVADAALI